MYRSSGMDARRRLRGTWCRYRWLLAVSVVGVAGDKPSADQKVTPSEDEKNGPPKGKRDLALHISPRWSTMTGFSDSKQTISGTLSLQLSYRADLLDERGMGDPRRVVDVKNFASGDYGRVAFAEMRGKGAGVLFTAMDFVGDFKQSLEMTCFPFDRQRVIFDISMQHPGEKSLFFDLRCHPGNEVVKASDGTVSSCSQSIGAISSGFFWDKFTCEKVGAGSVSCAMEGERKFRFKFQTFVFPAILFIIISFLSFHIRIEMAMPRVATTMIALLNINLLKNVAQRELPMVEEMSWLEEFLFAGVVCMFLNMVAHVISFHFGSDYGVNDMINDISGLLFPPVFFLYAAGRLNARDCGRPERSDYSEVLVVIFSLFLAIAVALFLRRHADLLSCCWRGGAGGDGGGGQGQEGPVRRKGKKRFRDDHDDAKEKHGGEATPPLSGPLRLLLETAVASIWPQGGPQLAEGFAKTLRAHWIVSREQLVSGVLGGPAPMSKATGLPLALCGQLIALAGGEGGSGGGGGAVVCATVPCADGVSSTAI